MEIPRHIMKYPTGRAVLRGPIEKGGAMKMFRTGKQLLAFFMPGFLLGIIYVNFIAKKYMAEPVIFSDYFLEQFAGMKIEEKEYIWYLLRLRVLPLLVLGGLSMTKARRISAALFLVWTGITGGILISDAALNMGIRGSILCVVALLPQFLLYGPADLVILMYGWMAPGSRWNRQKTVFVVLTMSAGILLELYVNPVLLKIFLSAL